MAMLGLFGEKKLKMKPLFILIAAIALGLIFLGVVLTIVGHWPGYTSWGSNPLKYLGPALLGIGIIAMVGVVAYCCVISEGEDPDNDLEKKEFVDLSNPQSGANTPSVVMRDTYDTEVKQPPPGSAFRPYTPNDDFSNDVNVLNMLKDSPSRDRKFSSNYNTGNGVKVPTPSYPSETSKKSVGYNSYAYSSDGDKMKVVVDQRPKPPYMQPANRFVPPQNNNADKVKLTEEPKTKTNYIQPVQTYIPPQGTKKWGSTEKIIDSSSGSKTPPRSPKSTKSNGNPNQGVFLERATRNDRDQGRMPALHQPVVGRRSRGRYRQGSSEEPSSPIRTTKPETRELEEPDLEIKRTLIVPNNQGKDAGAKWGSHNKNQNDGVSPSNGEGMSRERGVPTESTPRDEYSGREYDKGREYYNKQFSDPQGHMSRRERDRQSRSRHGSRSRDRESGSRRDRSSSGHRRHRSRSHERDGRNRARHDAYSAMEIDYITGAPIRKSGRSKSQERNSSRYGRSGSRRSRSHDRGLSHSYDSDEVYRRHRYHDQSSHSSRDPYRTGEVNIGYDRDGSSDDSHGLSPKHRSHHLNHSNSTGTSADDFLKTGQLALSPSSGNKKQTMNFTINVNAHPGSAVQIAMGGQKLPQARPMLPGNTSLNLTGNTELGGASDVRLTQIPHDSSIESSSSRTRPVRT